MKNNRLLTLGVSICFILGLVTMAFMTAWADEKKDYKELRIGYTGPLSGAGEHWGRNLLNPMILVAEEMNTKGGVILDGDRYLFKILATDDQFNPAIARTNITKLVTRDGVRFLCALGSGPNSSVSVLNQNEVLVTEVNWTRHALDANQPLWFQTMLSAFEMIPTYLHWLVKTYPDVKKVAMVGPNFAAGPDIMVFQEPLFEKLGLELVDKHTFEYGETDFGAVITRLLAKKPDYIDTPSMPADTNGYFVKQLREAGYTGLVGACNGTESEVVANIAGAKNAEGFLLIGAAFKENDPFTDPATLEFGKKYKARFGGWDDGPAKFSDNAFLTLKSIEAAGTTDVWKVADAMHKLRYKSILGGTTQTVWAGKEFYGINNQYIHPMCILQIHNGVARGVYKMSQDEIVELIAWALK